MNLSNEINKVNFSSLLCQMIENAVKILLTQENNSRLHYKEQKLKRKKIFGKSNTQYIKNSFNEFKKIIGFNVN